MTHSSRLIVVSAIVLIGLIASLYMLRKKAQLEKIPYLLVIGNNEMESGTVAPRKHGGKNLPTMTVDEFMNSIESELDPQKWREVE